MLGPRYENLIFRISLPRNLSVATGGRIKEAKGEENHPKPPDPNSQMNLVNGHAQTQDYQSNSFSVAFSSIVMGCVSRGKKG